MDVIALHQAGFAGAVAPLGTALTEEQLEELWRLSPVPILCFDGDAAGGRAAARAAETRAALAHRRAQLRIATMPAHDDPDTLVRRSGPQGFQAVLDSARPLADALFDLARETVGEATPEQRAALRTRLEAAAAQISDKALASEYRRALLDRFFARRANRPAFGNATPGRRLPSSGTWPGRRDRRAWAHVGRDSAPPPRASARCGGGVRHGGSRASAVATA